MRIEKSTGQVPYVLIALCALAALVYFALKGSLTDDVLAAGFFALLGTFVGALLAFRLEEAREKSKEAGRRQGALSRALMVLGAQQNANYGFAKAMRPYHTDVERATNLQALQPPEIFQLRQNLDELMFLLEVSDPNLLMDLYLEQERFDQTMMAVKMRNEFYVKQFQPAIAGKGLNNRELPIAEIKEAVGEYVFESIVSITRGMYFHVYESEKSIPIVFDHLRTEAKRLYPKVKFIRFDVKEPLPPASV